MEPLLENIKEKFNKFYVYIDISVLSICIIIVFVKNVDPLIRFFSILAQAIGSAFLFYRFDENVQYYYKVGLILCDFSNAIGASFGNRILFYLTCLITFILKVIGNGKVSHPDDDDKNNLKYPIIIGTSNIQEPSPNEFELTPIANNEYYKTEKIEQEEEKIEEALTDNDIVELTSNPVVDRKVSVLIKLAEDIIYEPVEGRSISRGFKFTQVASKLTTIIDEDLENSNLKEDSNIIPAEEVEKDQEIPIKLKVLVSAVKNADVKIAIEKNAKVPTT